jgi:hypothetical protein
VWFRSLNRAARLRGQAELAVLGQEVLAEADRMRDHQLAQWDERPLLSPKLQKRPASANFR